MNENLVKHREPERIQLQNQIKAFLNNGGSISKLEVHERAKERQYGRSAELINKES